MNIRNSNTLTSRKQNNCCIQKNFAGKKKIMSFTPSKYYNERLLTLELEKKKQCRMDARVSEDLFSLHSRLVRE